MFNNVVNMTVGRCAVERAAFRDVNEFECSLADVERGLSALEPLR